MHLFLVLCAMLRYMPLLCRHHRPAWRTGNFDTYVRTRAELEDNQMKQWQKEQDQVRPSGDCCAVPSSGLASQLPLSLCVSLDGWC